MTPILATIAREQLDENEIEDALQEVTFRAWRSLNSYKPYKGSFETWTKAILKNVIHDITTDKYRQKKISIQSIEGYQY